jgi:hypothetical protein
MARRGGALAPSLRTAIVGALLVLVLAGGWALRYHAASEPRRTLSADERSYVRLAQDLRDHRTYGDGKLRQPFHWAPATPVMFALAASGDERHRLSSTDFGAGPARTAQAVVSTATIAFAFGFAALVGGAWAGIAAAVLLAAYPPAIGMAGGFLSEPLGACALALGALALAWAWRGGAWRFAVAGAALGVACLARADTLPALAVVVPAVVVLTWRRTGFDGGLARGVLLAAGAAAILAPWVQYASRKAGHLVPVTDGGSSTLFIATSLESHGTLVGAKRALFPEACAVHPTICERNPLSVRAEYLLDAVAARHPDLPRDTAITREAHRNVREALDHPAAYARMLRDKFVRMWGGVFHGTSAAARDGAVVLWHRVLIGVALAGLLAGLIRARSGVLTAVALALLACTALNVVFVAEARMNARLVPVLVAAGAAGWALAVRRGAPRLPRLPARLRGRGRQDAAPSPPEARSAA